MEDSKPEPNIQVIFEADGDIFVETN